MFAIISNYFRIKTYPSFYNNRGGSRGYENEGLGEEMRAEWGLGLESESGSSPLGLIGECRGFLCFRTGWRV